jgi:hypothetical protein
MLTQMYGNISVCSNVLGNLFHFIDEKIDFIDEGIIGLNTDFYVTNVKSNL